MFTIYNSISNLGALNIESVILTVLIDQLAVRPFSALTVTLVIKFILSKYEISIRNSLESAHKSKKDTQTHKLFKLTIFRNLCEDLLIN
jgi:hypothetical protein